MDDIVRSLVQAGWKFSINWADGEFSICVWRPEWVTDDVHAAVICPEGKGQTLEEAYEDLWPKCTCTQDVRTGEVGSICSEHGSE